MYTQLFDVLKMCVGPNIREGDLRKIVDQTIEEADILDRDGRISRAEFAHVCFSGRCVGHSLRMVGYYVFRLFSFPLWERGIH